jgi:excisionase family DNA binding protein
MTKTSFTTSDIAQICHHSRETVKRWLEKGEINGYRVGASGHWRVLPKDLAAFLKRNHIPIPDPTETAFLLRDLAEPGDLPPFCWKFFRTSMSDHVRSNASCDDCLVYKAKSLDCRVLREEIGHKKIHCGHSCDACEYYRFLQER